MIEATEIVTTGQAWYDHWIAVAGQWSVLLGLAMGVIRFYHSWQKGTAGRCRLARQNGREGKVSGKGAGLIRLVRGDLGGSIYYRSDTNSVFSFGSYSYKADR